MKNYTVNFETNADMYFVNKMKIEFYELLQSLIKFITSDMSVYYSNNRINT